jgi:formiminotetrahydrofolate cyclodeaminase
MVTEDMKIRDYADVLSSKAPVPGGGGASALSGALGACLGQMVCNLTAGKKKYAAVEEDIRGILSEMKEHESTFFRLADRDAEVFGPLAKAYSMPSETDEEKRQKADIMEKLLLNAAEVPVKVMEEAVSVLDALNFLAEKGSVMAVSDVGVASQLIRTALTGAMMNVKINTKSMKDRGKAEEIDTKALELLKEGTAGADKIYNKVLTSLS